jgi:hypothetical protein
MRPALAVLVVAVVARVASAQPSNDECANATVVAAFPFSDTVDTTTATTAPGDPTTSECGGGVGTHSVWYRIPGGGARDILEARKVGSSGTFLMRVYTGTCAALTELNCNGSASFQYMEFAPQGQDVLLAVVNTTAAGGTLVLGVDKLPEFLLDTPASRDVTVAGGAGGFLAVWLGLSPTGLVGQLFGSQGNPTGSPFDVSPGTYQTPDGAAAGNGFVVVWDSAAVRIDPPGTVQSLPAVTPGGYPRVAADADGDFVVVWEGSDGHGGGIVAQRFDSAGTPNGGVFQVNTQTMFTQYSPAVAMAPGGEFVVVWQGPDGDDDGISGRLYDADGVAQGPEFQVNSATTFNQTRPGVGMDANGNFVIAWDDGGYIPPYDDPVIARRFDAAGVPAGPDFIVNTIPSYYPVSGHLDVAVAPAGEFMVTWETVGRTFVDVSSRRYLADGTPDGPQFLVNSYDRYAQYDPDVAAGPNGTFLVVWNDFRNLFIDDANEDSVVARAFPAAAAGGCAAAPVSGCRHPTVLRKSSLTVVDDSDDFHDQFRWSWLKGQATTPGDLGDPTVDESFSYCLYDATAALVFQADVPAAGTCGTRPCWRGVGSPPGTKGFTYKDTARTPHGVLKVVMKPGIDGRAKIVTAAGGLNVFSGPPGAPSLPLALPARVQLQSSGGQCWEAVYASSGVIRNEPGMFKGVGD